jgi:hypothetical protein
MIYSRHDMVGPNDDMTMPMMMIEVVAAVAG